MAVGEPKSYQDGYIDGYAAGLRDAQYTLIPHRTPPTPQQPVFVERGAKIPFIPEQQ